MVFHVIDGYTLSWNIVATCLGYYINCYFLSLAVVLEVYSLSLVFQIACIVCGSRIRIRMYKYFHRELVSRCLIQGQL